MRRIGGETSRLLEAPVESRECRVQYVDQATDLIRRAFRWNSFVESFGRYALGRAPNIFNRCERSDPSHQLPAAISSRTSGITITRLRAISQPSCSISFKSAPTCRVSS